MDNITLTDTIQNIFTDKYSKDDKLKALAFLERNDPELLVQLVKYHHPAYYYESFGKPEVAKFSLLKKLGLIDF